METGRLIWLEMELASEREEPLLASYMRIIFLGGKDRSGNLIYCLYFDFLQCRGFIYLYIVACRFSVSNDLKYDAERDLRDIGAKNIQVHSLNKVLHLHLILIKTGFLLFRY